MEYFEIFKRNGLYGIRSANSGKVFVESKYKSIREIKHHNDLTTVNFDEWFIFFENNYIDAHFGYISNGAVFISKNVYRELEHFYKGLTYCILKDDWVIVDKNENVIVSLSDFESNVDDLPQYELLYNAVESYHNGKILLALEQELCLELTRLFEITYSIKIDFKGNYSYHLAENSLCADFTPLILEYELGIRTDSQLYSEELEKLYDYDPFTGNFLVQRNNNQMAFINKYMYQVGECFEWFFTQEYFDNLLSPKNHNIEISELDKINNRLDFIGESGRIYLIEYAGDFVLESLFYPELFCEYSYTKNKIRKIFKTDNADMIELAEIIYHKFDKNFISREIELKRKTNPLFEESEEWVNQTFESNIDHIFDYQGYTFSLPFEWNNQNEEECRNVIGRLNSLIGITYSSYKKLAVVGNYKYEDERVEYEVDENRVKELIRNLYSHESN